MVTIVLLWCYLGVYKGESLVFFTADIKKRTCHKSLQ